MNHPDSSLPSSVADLAALGKMLEDHRSQLLAMIERRLDPALRARIDPEDILNEAFLEARRKWSNFQQQNEVSPYVWVYGIVRDCLIQVWRRENRSCREPKREMPWPEQSSVQLGLNLISPGASPSSAAARGELQQRVRGVVEMLAEKDREVLAMRHFDELTFREIAQLLGLQEQAATMRYVRALRRLKDLWQKLHDAGGSQA
jgi:RNA polymerase sigma-70 factor (ECF subfamily)